MPVCDHCRYFVEATKKLQRGNRKVTSSQGTLVVMAQHCWCKGRFLFSQHILSRNHDDSMSVEFDDDFVRISLVCQLRQLHVAYWSIRRETVLAETSAWKSRSCRRKGSRGLFDFFLSGVDCDVRERMNWFTVFQCGNLSLLEFWRINLIWLVSIQHKVKWMESNISCDRNTDVW